MICRIAGLALAVVLAGCEPNPCNRGNMNDTLEETYTNMSEFGDCQYNQVSGRK